MQKQTSPRTDNHAIAGFLSGDYRTGTCRPQDISELLSCSINYRSYPAICTHTFGQYTSFPIARLMSQFHFLPAMQLARQFRWFIQQPAFWLRGIALIPEYTVSPGIAAAPQSSSTADKAEYSIPGLDNRYDFSVIL